MLRGETLARRGFTGFIAIIIYNLMTCMIIKEIHKQISLYIYIFKTHFVRFLHIHHIINLT